MIMIMFYMYSIFLLFCLLFVFVGVVVRVFFVGGGVGQQPDDPRRRQTVMNDERNGSPISRSVFIRRPSQWEKLNRGAERASERAGMETFFAFPQMSGQGGNKTWVIEIW